MIPIKKPIAKLNKAEMRLTAASADGTSNGAANSTADLDHEKFMKENGIKTVDLSDELKEIDKVVKNAKKDDFESANEASRLIVEALQENIYQINESIEQIGETLTDHEQRIEALEEEEETPTSEITPEIAQEAPQQEVIQEVAPQRKISKEEQLLADLFSSGTLETNKAQLKLMGFNVGFFSKLTIRGGTYGDYQLVKKPSEKTYQIVKN